MQIPIIVNTTLKYTINTLIIISKIRKKIERQKILNPFDRLNLFTDQIQARSITAKMVPNIII